MNFAKLSRRTIACSARRLAPRAPVAYAACRAPLVAPQFRTFSVSRVAPKEYVPGPVDGKIWKDAHEAIYDMKPNMTVLSSGFGLCGTAETLIDAIASRKDLQNLTGVSNNAGNVGDGGLAPLIRSQQIKKMILSYLGSNKTLEHAYLTGQIGLELVPQGTLAERLACAGKGIPAFFTATGSGTAVETGQIPIRYEPRTLDGPLVIAEPGIAKDVRVFEDGRRYLMEPAVHGDFAILRAWKVDKEGNCVFRNATRTFGGLMARAAKTAIVEAENIVEIGEIDPMDVHLPGIYIDRIVPATVDKQIELITTTPAEGSEPSTEPLTPAVIQRQRIAKRAAKELKDGYYVNLGVGIPTLSVSFLKPGVNVWLESENGILGMGPYPTPDKVDADTVNAGKETVTLLPGASVFDSVESFGMIRGGHIDVSILGALQVSQNGDLASYSIPGKFVRGMGGAMDLVSNPDETRIVVCTGHTDKKGVSKIRKTCDLPLTGVNCISRIITDMCVFDVDRKNGILILKELADGLSVEDVRAATDADFLVADNVTNMEADD